MRRANRELWYSLVVILLSTLVYLAVMAWSHEIPAAGELYGHSIGILGFLLMLATETLYTLRKRSRSARWGSMSAWLELHIFTGLVGPYLVLLHSSWKFNGLAGLTMLLTGLIVVSGFFADTFSRPYRATWTALRSRRAPCRRKSSRRAASWHAGCMASRR